MAILAILLWFLKAPQAGQVEHHGNTVNADGHASECIMCHDGAIAKAVTDCIGIRCNISRINSHPVEKPYPTKESFVQYGDVLRSGIKLDEGQVSCISCHDLRNQERGHPVIQNRSDNLCFKCHIK